MDRRTIWAILLMMVIAFIPTFFIKKPVRPAAGVVSDTTAASAISSDSFTRPCTTCTSTSDGSSSPSDTNARTSTVVPSCGTSPSPCTSTSS